MSHYKTIPNNTLLVDVQETFNEIKQDLLTNQKEVFNRYNYYTTKYKGNRLNDINVGLIPDYYQSIVQIFVRNKTGYIREILVFDRSRTNVIETLTLNYKIHA